MKLHFLGEMAKTKAAQINEIQKDLVKKETIENF